MACFNSWDIGACGCIVNVSMLCKGCNGAALVTYAVQIYNTSGGTLLYSLTTDSSGHISLPTGTYWIQSADGLFAGPSFTVSTPSSITLTAATNYVCNSCCSPLPAPRTLSITDVRGSHVATWNATLNHWATPTTNGTWSAPTYLCSDNVSYIARCTYGMNDCNVIVDSGPCPYYYIIFCTGANKFQITRTWYELNCGGTLYMYQVCNCAVNLAGNVESSSTGNISVTCGSISWSGTLTYAGGHLADPVGGTVSFSQ
jgi:hypothetical protein